MRALGTNRRLKLSWLCLSSLILSVGTVRGENVPDTATLVSAAMQRARVEGKSVLVEFTGPRCIGCQELHRLLGSEPVRSILAARYVNVTVTAGYSGRADKPLMNAGAWKALQFWGGGASGLPYCVMLSPGGEKIADWSGFPQTSEGIDGFVGSLSRGMRGLSAAERVSLERAVTRQVRETVRRYDGRGSWGYFRAHVPAGAIVVVTVGVLFLVAWRLGYRRRVLHRAES